MANTISQRILVENLKNVVKYITIDSDGSEETDLVIYDSSVHATNLGTTDPLDCTVMSYTYSVVCANATAAALPQIKVEFDASTDVMAFNLPANSCEEVCFKDIGGLPNNAGTGITGDLLLTTTNLAAGDSIMLIVNVKRN